MRVFRQLRWYFVLTWHELFCAESYFTSQVFGDDEAYATCTACGTTWRSGVAP